MSDANTGVIALLLRSGALTEEKLRHAERVHARIKPPRPLLAVLKELGFVDDAVIDEAITAAPQDVRLGEVLVDKGLLTVPELERALALQRAGSGKRLGAILLEQDLVSEEQLLATLSLLLRVPVVHAEFEAIDAAVVRNVPIEIGRTQRFIPLRRQNGGVLVAFADPLDPNARAAADSVFDREQVLVTLSAPRSIELAWSKVIAGRRAGAVSSASDEHVVVAAVDSIIDAALEWEASDIHIEPMADRVRLRYRIDGVCVERDNLPKRMQNAVIARFKLMAGMNIAEKRVPQDGRIKMPIDDKTIDFRVSACPAYHGDSVVLRILRPDSVRIGLENIGFEAENLQVFNKIIRRPNGIFLVTGPTGSGKTTTLYSALDILNRPDKKIITAEDPIEYAFTGINQCQVRESIGLNFSSVLRAMLRQAPNIILVGEIRDKEVAEVAIQAALTGHLVFSTLHTNDAPSAMTRLIDMGVKPFLVASSIQAVMAQRLIRVLCPKCKQPDTSPDPKYLQLVGITKEDLARNTIYKPVGCENCSNTGYRGRKAIFEMMVMNSELRDLTFRQETVSLLRKAAIASGMRTLVEDGKVKVLKGTTTPGEIARMAQVGDMATAG
ncbi:MAG TPA: pilus assembly protein PilB [Phycisphaerales bacterium]|nr:pilus assembly protein PilB [Phycisphaerales bacterium]